MVIRNTGLSLKICYFKNIPLGSWADADHFLTATEQEGYLLGNIKAHEKFLILPDFQFEIFTRF